MPALNLPQFYDTWIAEDGLDSTINYTSSSTLKVGELTSSGVTYQGTTLLKIPLNEIPAPSNARITALTSTYTLNSPVILVLTLQ